MACEHNAADGDTDAEYQQVDITIVIKNVRMVMGNGLIQLSISNFYLFCSTEKLYYVPFSSV
jgi:hypothetical protein